MDRKNFYFKHLVTEAILDKAFDYIDTAFSDLKAGIGAKGVAVGGEVTEAIPASYNVYVPGPLLGYDALGKRIKVIGTQTIDMSIDEASAATAVVTPANQKWLSLFVKHAVSLQTPEVDGNALTVYTDVLDSYEFDVVQGAEAPTATKPALRSDSILVADVLIIEGQTTILNADFDFTRAEKLFNTDSGVVGSAKGKNVNEFGTALLAALNATTGVTGSEIVGIPAIPGSTISLSAGDLKTALTGVVAGLDDRVQKDVADTITQPKTLAGAANITVDPLKANDAAALIDQRAHETLQPNFIAQFGNATDGSFLRHYSIHDGFFPGFIITQNMKWDLVATAYKSDEAGECKMVILGGAGPLDISTFRYVASAADETVTLTAMASIGHTAVNKEPILYLGDTGLPGHVALNDNITQFSEAQPNTLNANNICKAWASISTNGAGGITLKDSYNIDSVSISTTAITVTFENNMASADYAVIGTTTAAAFVMSASNATSNFIINHQDAAGAFINFATFPVVNISIVVYGNQ